MRDRNRRKDVILNLPLKIWFLYPRFALSTGQQSPLAPNTVIADQTTWGVGLGEIGVEQSSATVTVFSSQWTTDYAPTFGMGRYLVFELPDPVDFPTSTATLGPRLSAAVRALSDRRSDVEAGEWSDCVEPSRSVAELLRSPEEVASVLKADGLSEAATDDLLKAIRGAFNFASKFLKKIEQESGEVNPVVVARKEDADYVYSNSLTLVNLLSRKAARSPGSPEAPVSHLPPGPA